MNVQKEARRDAREYARAKMFYGEGAGNRRKLIATSVAAKSQRYAGYNSEFQKELARQDMAEHADAARKERRRMDRAHAINKNVKAAASGNYAGVNAGILVIAGVTYIAHQTGYDKRIIANVKARVQSFKARRAARHAPVTADGVHNITSL